MLHGAARRLVEPLIGVECVVDPRGKRLGCGRAQQASVRRAARDHTPFWRRRFSKVVMPRVNNCLPFVPLLPIMGQTR